MADSFLDKVHDQSRDTSRDLYAKWSETFHCKVSSNGFVTPQRCAKALAQFVSDLNVPILDYGCLTELAGEAVRAECPTILHGYNISKEMLALADDKSIYSVLNSFDPDEGLEISAGIFHAISAIRVISLGPAPPSTFYLIFNLLTPDGQLVFSFNYRALEGPAFAAKVKGFTASSRAKFLFKECGEHPPDFELKTKVYVMKKA